MSGRRRMMKSGALSYVTDGLIMHLDGTDRGGVVGHWTDLVAGYDFTLHDCTEASDHITLNGTSSYGICTTQNLADYRTTTIEVVLKKTNTASQAVYQGGRNTNHCWCLRISSERITASSYSSHPSKYWYHEGMGAKTTISVSEARAMQDLTALTYIGTNYGGTTDNNQYIGARYNSYLRDFFEGDIFCIRMYNRQLTEDEIRQNQQVDKQKYGL